MKVEMAQVQIIGLKTELRSVLRLLHRFGLVHIDQVSDVEEVPVRSFQVDRETIRKKEDMRFLISQLDGLIETLDCEDLEVEASELEQSEVLEQAHSGVDQLEPAIEELLERREKLEAQRETFPRYRATLRELLPLLSESPISEDRASLGLLVSKRDPEVFGELHQRVMEQTRGQAKLSSREVSEFTRALLITFPRQYAGAVEELMGEQDLSRVQLPRQYAHQAPDVAIEAINRRLDSIPMELAGIERQLAKLADQWGHKLVIWRQALHDQLEELEILSHLGETERTFVLVGWVPEKDLQKLKQVIGKMGRSAWMRELPMTSAAQQRAPVVLKNPAPARPFEDLVELLARPRYQGIDPTVLMAIFLPLFFGMILGDAGYGVILLAISLWMMRKFKTGFIHDLLIILSIGAGWTIVFGLLFGEVFGTVGEQLGLHPIWFNRAEAEFLPLLLGVTIGVGAAHITLGLLIGVWQAIQEKSRNELMERGGRLIALSALFILVGVLVDYLPEGLMTPSIAAMMVGIVVLSVPMGWTGLLIGPIEFISLIGNVLSYLRIAAIGLASVFLAKVANQLAGVVGTLLVGVIVALLIHALNIVLGTFSPSIQSLRLHYVEFFRKFYEGGGRPYKPFKSRYTSL